MKRTTRQRQQLGLVVIDNPQDVGDNLSQIVACTPHVCFLLLFFIPDFSPESYGTGEKQKRLHLVPHRRLSGFCLVGNTQKKAHMAHFSTLCRPTKIFQRFAVTTLAELQEIKLSVSQFRVVRFSVGGFIMRSAWKASQNTTSELQAILIHPSSRLCKGTPVPPSKKGEQAARISSVNSQNMQF
ncbi:MAG: hypothetical protein ILM98_15700 [Kiritimatiellae bacterium]|nr:hypothetical protein [Kiritimatiellia bacterium]